MRLKRRHPNQYSQTDFRGLYLLLVTMAIGGYLWYRFQEPINPLISHTYGVAKVYAVEPIVRAPMTIEDKIRATFPEDPDTAVEIAKCESSLNPKAINTKNKNGSIDYGLFQINSIHGYTSNYLLDVDNNLKVARKLYDRQGWKPWVCYGKVK